MSQAEGKTVRLYFVEFPLLTTGFDFQTLVLQDGTLNVTPEDRPVYFSDQQLFFLQNVKIPRDVTSFPVFNPTTKMILSLSDGNVFSTIKWDEKSIKSAEDYVTFLLW